MIAIIDYGAGNLKNVQHALKTIGISSRITDQPSDLEEAEGIILPGVGAFGEAMKRLRESGFDHKIIQQAEAGKPLLGICLGMQLLFEKSYEYGEHEGLGLIPGEIVPFEGAVKVPHMGWNQLELNGHFESDPIQKQIGEGEYVYFVHSLYARPADDKDVLFTTTYGETFTSAVKRENVTGMQFHPEKSSNTGMQLLKNFGGIVS
ncbi:imidazole glycerol phosphate synthase subunit HisH [Halalkalibacillus sediminis]|uniref:Imidazole glycerol phosphate synthase subunit HisH n=1 Tax=Halalkalibacillus sediminis TaxID=2018042 RepID=A0A2I0QRS1_9BACI|nr:imidazole glycerol phosphate synthase subunit HisH [Halalkalibacillus sediminis]PKR77037.1 imidazole glycerol phosphate synthase subunit HisH [Halalkalibacillus sediminis]